MSVLTTGPTARPRPSRLAVTPAVVAHRGASGYRPEHTLDAYRTAIRMGADAIELDLVPTADGVLLARHENELGLTTDVAERAELAHLRTTKVVDGASVTGWFSEDLTLAEARALTARERRPHLRPGNTVYDGREHVPTLDEVLTLVAAESVRRGRAVGVLLELKCTAYFDAVGLPVDEPLLADLRRHGLDRPRSGVTLMSFDAAALRRLASRTRVPLVQLLDVGDPVDGPALDAIEEYADGLGVHQELVLPRTVAGALGAATTLVRDAHRRWLDVHVWTLRAENHDLPTDFRVGSDPAGLGDLGGLVQALLEAGADGLITDHPDLVVPLAAAAA